MICPHCNRKIDIPKMCIEKAFIKCTKCLQTIEITNNKPTKTIPKELTPKKILDKI